MARDLRRSLLLVLARWLKAWVERLLAEDASAAPRGTAEELEVPPHAVDEPPAHWVERVRQSAPELLIGLKLPRSAGSRPPPSTSRPEARSPNPGPPPDRGRRTDPRRGAVRHEPRAAPAPDGRFPPPPVPPVAAREPPPAAPPAPAASVLSGRATAAGAREVPGAEPRSQIAPAGPRQHGVLRWSEHARRTELARHPPRHPEPRIAAPGVEAPGELRPEARPEEDQPDWALPPFEDLAPERVVDRPLPEEIHLASEAPGRWPELLSEPPPEEEREELVRRLERRQRIASEQRGE